MTDRYEVNVWQGKVRLGRPVFFDRFDDARTRARARWAEEGGRCTVSVFDVGNGAVVLRINATSEEE